MEYRYWIVRYVPNLAREEFVNIGVVCGADEGDWQVRFDLHDGDRRMTGHAKTLRSWADWSERRLRSLEPALVPGELTPAAWIEQLRARGRSAIRLSEARPIASESAEAAVELLFPLMVESESTRRPRTGLTRRTMRHEVMQLLQHELEFELGSDLFAEPRVSYGNASGGKFDIGRRDNGQPVLTNTWTFNVQDPERVEKDAQAANWLVSRIRAGGTTVTFGLGGEVPLDDRAQIEAVFDPPRRGRGDVARVRAYEAVAEGWELNGVRARTFEAVLSEPALTLA